jgi:hypothetical protein
MGSVIVTSSLSATGQAKRQEGESSAFALLSFYYRPDQQLRAAISFCYLPASGPSTVGMRTAGLTKMAFSCIQGRPGRAYGICLRKRGYSRSRGDRQGPASLWLCFKKARVFPNRGKERRMTSKGGCYSREGWSWRIGGRACQRFYLFTEMTARFLEWKGEHDDTFCRPGCSLPTL